MRNSSMLTPIFFAFLAFSLCHISIAISLPRYVADINFTVNCGSSGSSWAQDNRKWIGDIDSKFTPTEENIQNKSITSTAQSQGSFDAVPYMTARLSYSQFTYVFRVTSGPKFVRLHFCPAATGLNNFVLYNDFFTVKAGSFTLLRNFSASILATYLGNKTFYKEFCVNVTQDQKLNLTFIPSPSASNDFYAFINGIEIISMPTDLYYHLNGKGLKWIRQTPLFYMKESMAFEKVFRLNVGGSDISPTQDTGMFREWSADINYMVSNSVIPRNPSLILNYRMIPNYTAPDDIYRSARSMGPHSNLNLLNNLTWKLPVLDSGFNYLVRLHFCELETEITGPGQRQFIIYIDNETALDRADIMMWSDGAKDVPVYQDFVVRIEDGEPNLFIALHPQEATDAINDAILNGIELLKLSDNGNLAGTNPPFVLLPAPDQQPASTAKASKISKTVSIAIGSVAGFSVLLALACCAALWKLRRTKHYGSYYPLSKCWCWPDHSKGKSTRTKASSLPDELCRHFSLEEIKIATSTFHEELIVGRGGFGAVFKGFIDHNDQGAMIVAIKRLNPESKQGAREFWREIDLLSQLRHGHLVSLIGYCDEDNEMILVYDYMTNGTLRDQLYDTVNDSIPWKQRLDICIGAARGLNYLHTGAKRPIIHRDVKTTNILLDEKWVAKVSDFGLSRMGLDNSAVTTAVMGTWGYLDPEYARRQQLTEKSDVYSFGVVLFEVLCARKALNSKLEDDQKNLAHWARKCIERGTIGEIIDPYLKGKISPESFKVYVAVAESCVRDAGIDRPTMNDVMEKLDFALELQNNADAAKEKTCPGGEHTYPEVLSFPVGGTTGAPMCASFHNRHAWEDDSGTGLTTTVEMTNRSIDSDTNIHQDVLMDTTESKV